MSKPTPAITLFRGSDTPRQYVWSPFVTKLEFRLRVGGLTYTPACGSPRASPTGQIPYITLTSQDKDGDVKSLGDSTRITQHFIAASALRDLNAGLSAKDAALDVALRCLIEERLNACHGYERWVVNYYTMRDGVLGSIPWAPRVLIGLLAARKNGVKMEAAGLAGLSEEEVFRRVEAVWEVVARLLESARPKREGDGWWVLAGKEPTEADATVFGFAASVMVCGAAGGSKRLLREKFPVIVEWAGWVHKGWFKEYELWKEE
ncbi:hypothetical protein BU24DRAFT_213582 [Aaosphaeria arxii CBS 175.79]|uniref:Thioredoxin-like fold domain-containing protein n=1 Tax=Aaosphaeria arxii CBS 175.79 TaxID=1450172 RepID=A0A6A5XNP0_9PLEO|nr:uncharacterized protein BU24DRAFT_213582 [Aaosphaeria arxii CBS 175.79]KAF2014381.1 hypothetical protein BU24DRAFT_213582 [Aaosphaeria arxii CBS 175.79]